MTGFYGGQDDGLDAYLPGDDQSNGLAAIADGSYPAVVVEVEPTQTAKGGFMWKLTLEVADGGPANGRKLFYNMNWLDGEGRFSGGIGFTQLALKALGLPAVSNSPSGEQTRYRRSDIVGKRVIAVVSTQMEGQYRGRNQTDRLEPVGGAAPAAGGWGGPPPAAAPPAAGGWGGAPAAPPAPPAWGAPAAPPAPPAAGGWGGPPVGRDF